MKYASIWWIMLLFATWIPGTAQLNSLKGFITYGFNGA